MSEFDSRDQNAAAEGVAITASNMYRLNRPNSYRRLKGNGTPSFEYSDPPNFLPYSLFEPPDVQEILDQCILARKA